MNKINNIDKNDYLRRKEALTSFFLNKEYKLMTKKQVVKFFSVPKEDYNMFDEIIAGKDVQKGKPNPEIYLKAMDLLGVLPEETLIFEDTEVGLQAAEASGANYVKVTGAFFDDENSHKYL